MCNPMSLRGPLRAAGMAVCLSMAMPGSPAGAQPAADPPAEAGAPDRKAAGDRFREAEAAFLAGDFVRAGTLFEEANRLAPHPSALWNAARAWQRAGDPARAMNLYARYLEEAPADAPDRAAAATAVGELRPRVARLEIQDRNALTDVHVDERPVSGATVWVTPGAHQVRARRGGAQASALVTATAGGDHAVRLEARGGAGVAPGATPPGEGAPLLPGPDRGEDPPRNGWPPVVFIIGASVTAVSASWLVWSGIDTQNKRDAYRERFGDVVSAPQETVDAAAAAKEEGDKAQQRTNFLIGSTAAVGAFTVVSFFLTDWRGAAERRRQQAPKGGVSVGPGSVVVHGAF